MALRLLWLVPAVIFGIVLFWLGPVKLVSRLMDRLGICLPCPAAIAPLLDHPLRGRYTESILDHVGIREGERVLELQIRSLPQHLWASESEAFGEQAKEGGGKSGFPATRGADPDDVLRVRHVVKSIVDR